MKVGIIAANNITYSPYISFYTKILKTINVKYELIMADRYGLQEEFDAPVHVYKWENEKPIIATYIKYASYIKKTVKKERYEFLVVLTSINAVVLAPWLIKHYKKHYIVDIRDYTHENIRPYFLMEKIALNNSMLNVISSKKFIEFLPKSKYLVCHNYEKRELKVKLLHNQDEPIRIGYVGGISYIEQCRRLMDLVSKDNRFVLDFYGTSSKELLLKEALNECRCDRIHFHGAYIPKEKDQILQNVDILFNAYGNGSPLLDYALSNKLYDALIYRKPILTCSNTFMTEMAGPLAYPIDLSDRNALNDLYNWYIKFDDQVANEYANKMLKSIEIENTETNNAIANCLLTTIYKNENEHSCKEIQN